jgi:hypothetical protein
LQFRVGWRELLSVARRWRGLRFWAKALEHGRLALIEEPNLIEDLKFEGLFEQASRRLMQRFVAKAESAKVHWNHHLRAQLTKSLQGLLRIHMHIPFRGRFIGTDGKQSQLNVRTLADLFESLKVSGVAAVKNRPSCVFDKKAAESSMAIVENSRSPMTRGGEGDLECSMFKTLPMAQLVDAIKSESMDETADVLRNRDRLIARDRAKCAAVEMIEMGVRDQNQVDGGKVAKRDSGMFDALDDLQPLRPIRVDEDTVLGSLNKEGGVPDPRHANLPYRELGEHRLDAVTVALGEERRYDDFGEKVPLVPSFA